MRSTRTGKKRQGAAVVEFAVCLPVLITLVLGAIECCSMIFLDQSLNVVAYEGIRTAIKSGANAGDGRSRALQVIAERKLQQTQVTFSPANPEDADRGTPITIRVTAPCQANSVMGLSFFSGSLETTAFMIKE
jgi:hypothetical protein